MAPVLKTFFGCFQLRTGCLVIGYLGAISSLICVIASLAGLIFTGLRESSLKGDDQYVNGVLMWVCGMFFLICGISFALYVVLLVGVQQERPNLLRVYVSSMTTFLVITFILSIVLTVFNLGFGIRCLVSFICSIYYLLVVRSYYFEMKESKQMSEGIKPV